jgi:hypothetical protein
MVALGNEFTKHGLTPQNLHYWGKQHPPRDFRETDVDDIFALASYSIGICTHWTSALPKFAISLRWHRAKLCFWCSRYSGSGITVRWVEVESSKKSELALFYPHNQPRHVTMCRRVATDCVTIYMRPSLAHCSRHRFPSRTRFSVSIE